MIDFWLLVALLLAAALSFVWWPLFIRRRTLSRVSRRDLNIQAFETQVADLESDQQAGRIDAEQFEALKLELERNLLGDVQPADDSKQQPVIQKGSSLTAVMFSVVVVAISLGLYLQHGSSGTLQKIHEQQNLLQKLSDSAPEERLAILERAVQDDPEQVEIWYALAKFYAESRQLEKTQYAYDQLLKLIGEDASILAEYAQVLFFLKGNPIGSEVTSVAERALQGDPRNVTALGLMGISAFEQGHYAKAIARWQTALSASPDDQGTEAFRAGIERARALMAEEAQSTPVAQLVVEVSLDDTLAAQVKPDQLVFVVARAVNGPKMPLAAHRLRVKDLPTTVILNDEMAMQPELKLSLAEKVEVLARVSLSGQPVAQSGDLQGSFSPVKVSSQEAPISLVINQVVN